MKTMTPGEPFPEIIMVENYDVTKAEHLIPGLVIFPKQILSGIQRASGTGI